MAIMDVTLPEIGEGVHEGELVRWLVKAGDVLKHDQPMVEVMTDKATVEIPCAKAGKVVKLLAKEGDVVKVGGALLSVDTDASTATPSAPPPVASKPQAPAVQMMSAVTVAAEPAPSFIPAAGVEVLATPATRRYARELRIDLNKVKGTGPMGRITREDVARMAQGAGAVSLGQPKPAMMPSFGVGLEERVPLRGIRKKIAENLVKSKHTIPHFTHADEVDVTELVKWRTSLKDQAEKSGVKLTYLPFVMKALATTIKEFPQFNASIDEEKNEIVYKKYFNIGFAADTPDGLMVPVVKNVESKNVLTIAQEIATLADRARTGKATPEDLKGATITVTNIGSIGGISATPIIQLPQVAIIGIFKIVKKPVVVNDQVVIRDMMGITATCDHRMIDGAQAARCVNKLMQRLSNPQSLLLEMI